jgi:predicted ATPase
LLPERDRIVLRRLSVFPVGFSLEAAVAVVADDMISYVDVIDAVASLVGKSMLSADTGSNISRYRLLDTTRDYAKRKLAEAGETEQVLSRYAEYDDGRHARDADH